MIHHFAALIVGLLVPTSAFAHLGGLEIAIPLSAFIVGFVCGAISLGVSLRRRWLFLVVPLLVATGSIVWKVFAAAADVPFTEMLAGTAVFAALLLIQGGVGFGLAVLGLLTQVHPQSLGGLARDSPYVNGEFVCSARIG